MARKPTAEKIPPYREASYDLIRHLRMEMDRKGINNQLLADYLGIAYSHLVALMAGERNWAGLDREVVERIAAFLRVPVLQVYFWSGFIKQEDQDFPQTVDDRCDLTRHKMLKDPYVVSLVPNDREWERTPRSAKLAIVLLYMSLEAEILDQHIRDEFPDSKVRTLEKNPRNPRASAKKTTTRSTAKPKRPGH